MWPLAIAYKMGGSSSCYVRHVEGKRRWGRGGHDGVGDRGTIGGTGGGILFFTACRSISVVGGVVSSRAMGRCRRAPRAPARSRVLCAAFDGRPHETPLGDVGVRVGSRARDGRRRCSRYPRPDLLKGPATSIDAWRLQPSTRCSRWRCRDCSPGSWCRLCRHRRRRLLATKLDSCRCRRSAEYDSKSRLRHRRYCTRRLTRRSAPANPR